MLNTFLPYTFVLTSFLTQVTNAKIPTFVEDWQINQTPVAETNFNQQYSQLEERLNITNENYKLAVKERDVAQANLDELMKLKHTENFVKLAVITTDRLWRVIKVNTSLHLLLAHKY